MEAKVPCIFCICFQKRQTNEELSKELVVDIFRCSIQKEKKPYFQVFDKDANEALICYYFSLGLSWTTGENETAKDDDRPVVDVRDLAEAILLAYEKPEAEGRYICSSYVVRSSILVEKLKSMFPDYNYPKR